MRSKFISAILCVAVMLSLMLVPAVPTAVANGTDWGYEISPNMTKVGFNQDFNVTVKLVCYAGETDTWNIMVDFDQTYLQVIGITRPATLPNGDTPDPYPSSPVLNNTDGWVFDGYGVQPATPPHSVNVSFNAWTIHFKSLNATTSGTPLNFVTVDPLRSTMAMSAGTDYLNWAEVVNGTVKVGSPTLTVNVIPGGKGTVNQVPSGPYSWDQVVNLTAVNSTAGWGWASWSGTDNNAVNPTTVTMSTDKTVNATFAEKAPELAVSPLSLAFSARYGNKTDSKTVTISNTGGGTLCWAVGSPPAWTTGDNWTYYDTYSTWMGAPYGNPYYVGVGANNTPLVLTVTNTSNSNYNTNGVWSPVAERTIEPAPGTFIPAQCIGATIVNDKFTLDYVQQTASLVLFMPNATPVYATVTWTYSGCHGWPYYVGKSWSYSVTQSVSLTPGGTPILPPKTSTGYATVVGIENVIVPAGNFSCYKTVHYLDPGNISTTTFTQTWFNDTVKNFVKIWDIGTFAYPPENARVLLSYNVADPPPPPAWISFDKTHGSLGIGGSEVLNVTASSSGLAVGNYAGNFTISAAGSIQTKTVGVSLEVLPATTIDVIRNLPADALNLDAEYPGDTFDVWVNFTAPIDDFNAIGLTDLAPAGWAVQTNTAWCDPVASWTKGEGNKAEYSWSGPYLTGQVFHARYTVTIPATAANGLNTWPNNDGSKAWAEYWFGAQGPYTSAVTGEFEKIVTVPGKVWGETREVNADLLTTTLVVCSENPAELGDEPEDSDSSTAPNAIYSDDVDDTGQYYLTASKYCWFDLNTSAMPTPRNPSNPLYIDLGTTAKLAAGCNLDFEGDYGLVPKACTMSYAMKSVNHWLFVPIDGSMTSHPEWQLSVWKAMESVHSWQFPMGCST